MSFEMAVIFDMDGVLVDSYRAHWESWHFMADELGRGLTEEQFVSTFGRTSREIIAEHWGAESLTPEEIAQIAAWINEGAAAPEREEPEPDPRAHWSFQPPQRAAVPEGPALATHALRRIRC